MRSINVWPNRISHPNSNSHPNKKQPNKEKRLMIIKTLLKRILLEIACAIIGILLVFMPTIILAVILINLYPNK